MAVYHVTEDLTQAARRWNLLGELHQALDVDAPRHVFEERLEGLTDRLDRGTAYRDARKARGLDVEEAEDKWITLLRLYCLAHDARWTCGEHDA